MFRLALGVMRGVRTEGGRYNRVGEPKLFTCARSPRNVVALATHDNQMLGRKSSVALFIVLML